MKQLNSGWDLPKWAMPKKGKKGKSNKKGSKGPHLIIYRGGGVETNRRKH